MHDYICKDILATPSYNTWLHALATCSCRCMHNSVTVTGFDFHAHNSKIYFSPSHDSCTHQLTYQTGISAENYPGCFCCDLIVSESCQTSTSAGVIFEWLYLHWTSSQLAVNHHKTGW